MTKRYRTYIRKRISVINKKPFYYKVAWSKGKQIGVGSAANTKKAAMKKKLFFI